MADDISRDDAVLKIRRFLDKNGFDVTGAYAVVCLLESELKEEFLGVDVLDDDLGVEKDDFDDEPEEEGDGGLPPQFTPEGDEADSEAEDEEDKPVTNLRNVRAKKPKIGL